MGLVPLAAVLGTFATGGSRELALRFGIVRQPDPFVPQHTRPVAALGGLALAAAAAVALALDAGGSSISGAMITGALLFLAVGLLDDVHGLSPAWKLALQIVAATVPVALGLTLPISGNGLVDAVAAVVWIVVLVNAVNLTVTSLELNPTTAATAGGTCLSPTPPSPCTLSISVRLSDLGISPGNGLYGLTGLSLYFFGTDEKPPLLRVEGGNSELADATAPIHYLGSGTP